MHRNGVSGTGVRGRMADPPPDLKSGEGAVSTCSYGFGYMRKSWQSLVREAEGARSAGDPEHIHRMRVASRRLRAAIPIFRSCFPAKKYRKWRKEIKNITASLGEARDLDVQIAFLEQYLRTRTGDLPQPETSGRPPQPGPVDVSALLGHIRQKREQVQPAVEAAAASLRKGGTLDEFGAVLTSSPGGEGSTGKHAKLHRKAQNIISARTDDLLVYESFVHDPDAVARHHEMRIAAKRLRYTLEVFNRCYAGSLKPAIRRVRALQDVLGKLHDCDVWIGCLPAFVEEPQDREPECIGEVRIPGKGRPGIPGLLEDRTRERARLYRRFVEMWEDLRESRFFETLQELVVLPQPGKPGDESR